MAVPASDFGENVVPDSREQRIARLSQGQRECLELVNQHLSSKEIALRLGISPHTVDQRVRQALQILGVEKRGEAARLVAAAAATATIRISTLDTSTAAYRPGTGPRPPDRGGQSSDSAR